jgi:hypothetical protein
MPVDAIVRVSFQSSTPANQAANSALVGHAQNATGHGPFAKVNTACYTCSDANEVAVAAALAQLGQALVNYAAVIDFVSISLVRHGAAPGPDVAAAITQAG